MKKKIFFFGLITVGVVAAGVVISVDAARVRDAFEVAQTHRIVAQPE